MSRQPRSLPKPRPILSRGKHRNPHTGGCFMEFASYLAGERWSDRPTCTHPLLAAVARNVNDSMSDSGRQRLVELIPSVIGLTTDDPHVDAAIAFTCAAIALPVVSPARQRVLAAEILTCDRVLAHLDGRGNGELAERTRRTLAQVPEAEAWARRLTDGISVPMARFRSHVAPSIVEFAVEGIVWARLPDLDDVLRELLVAAIRECSARVDAEPATPVGPATGRPAPVVA